MTVRYFPQGIVTDFNFCNREKERLALKKSIESHEHVVLVGPRRYGKTSLIAQVLKENSFSAACMDFFFALTQIDVNKIINDAVSHIVSELMPKKTLLSRKLLHSVVSLHPKLTFNLLGQKLEISTKETTERSISELLLTLDQFAMKAKKKCVLVFDEFQQIGLLKENHVIEAAIRHAVERSEGVSYIFCGSHRHLLNEMFSDKSRPLYHLCDLMTIDRINAVAYQWFLNKLAKRKWKKELNLEVLNEIIYLTERHPYYINGLSRRLWQQDTLPSLSLVRQVWDEYVQQQANWLTNDLSYLTLNRRKVLVALANHPTDQPQSHAFSVQTGLNPSGIKKCLDDLLKLDLIYLDEKKYYRVLDPVMAYFIRPSG